MAGYSSLEESLLMISDPGFKSMKLPDSFFGELSPDQFLSEYWHKQPLLVRNAWPGFETPLKPDDFMTLSSREDALSRLIVENPESDDWDVSEGPFERSTFDSMPDAHWTLLIQEVDRLVPEVRDMLKAVSSIPNWRLDDVMISYAANGGGVGAHIDNYDVFLIQGFGQRRWQINTTPVVEEVLVEDLEISILADFEPDRDWVLNPGDMLYLPPRVAHFGVALGPCMTYSIGCRAPSKQEVLGAVLEQVLLETDPDERYADPELQRSDEPGRLGRQSVAWVRSMLDDIVSDESALTEMVGSIISQPRRYVDEEALPDESLQDALANRTRVRPASSSQVLYELAKGGQLWLFAAGEAIQLDQDFLDLVRKLIEGPGLNATDLSRDAEFSALMEDLFSQGTLVVD